MIHVVVVAGLSFCVVDAIGFRGNGDLIRRAGQATDARIERTGVLIERLLGITLGIDGNEERLDLVGEGPKHCHRVSDVAKGCWAEIGAMGVAEENQ